MRFKLNPIEWYKRGLIRKARRNGLDMADDCRIIGLPNFGTEPWLIKIGKHVTLTSGVRFITHDGGTWVFRDQPRYKDVFKFGYTLLIYRSPRYETLSLFWNSHGNRLR